MFTNIPNNARTPPRKFGSVGSGIIIEGLSSGDSRYDMVFGYLNNLVSSGNMDYLKQAFNYLISYSDIGSLDLVRPWSAPLITIGVNYSGFETYCSIYASKVGGTYIYNVVSPGYFKDPGLQNNAVSVQDYDYHVNGSSDYWVRLNDYFAISTTSSIATDVFPNLYPRNEVYMTNGTDYKIVVDETNGLHYSNNPQSQFSNIALDSAPLC